MSDGHTDGVPVQRFALNFSQSEEGFAYWEHMDGEIRVKIVAGRVVGIDHAGLPTWVCIPAVIEALNDLYSNHMLNRLEYKIDHGEF